MGQLPSRQEVINNELCTPAARDWLVISLALRDATKALAASMHHWIAGLHRRMKRSVSTMDPCNQNCSQTKTDGQLWCSACVTWQREILTLCQPRYKDKIIWTRFRSMDWPSNPYEVARVFIARAHRLYYKSNEFHEDIRFVLCLMENCSELNVPQALVQKAWVLRNSFKRRGRMRAKKKDMRHALSVLTELLQVPQVAEHQGVAPVLQKLTALQRSSDDEQGCCIL